MKIINKIFNSSSTKGRAARGGLWLGAGSGSEQCLRLVRNMILTRILAPEAFGLMAIVLSVNAAFESFTQIGIKEAVIQNPNGHKKAYLNGAWWLSLGRSFALYLLVFCTAPFVANFYDNQALVPLMRVAFLSFLLNGLLSCNAFVALKQMNFKRWAVLFHGGGAVGICTAVMLAFWLENVWALVIGYVVEALARCVLSYIICPFRPGFVFDREGLRALLKYASGVFGLPILTFIFLKADIFVVGKMFTMAELGLYSMAALIAWAPFQFLSTLTAKIAMPAFSENQQDHAMINKWAISISALICYIGFPMSFFIVCYGGELLSLLYGPKYTAVALPFAIIFLTALIRTSSVPIGSVYFAIGRPELARLITGVRAFLVLVLLYPSIKLFGLSGAALAPLAAMLVSYVVQVKKMKELTGLPMQDFFQPFAVSIMISAVVLVPWLLTRKIQFGTMLVTVAPGVVGCALAYFGIALIYYKRRRHAAG